ncbi:MAG: phosphonate metabolism transcriptional regulator PhnF [Gammaproteobacteria bacterium]|nr:phosphonate metabolism transcriptional regulator PhnF [Gammaproteobacteria bacterium]
MAVYQDIARILEREIREQFRSGDYLPSEAQLAKRFAINRHTVRRAVDELVDAGMVLRQQGKGTRVLEHAIEYNIASRGRFSESVEALGHHAEAEVVSRALCVADDALARKMWVEPGTPLWQLDTLRSVDGRPVTLISHYLCRNSFPELVSRYPGGSLHAFLETHYGVRMTRRQGLVSAVLPTAQESALLNYPRNMPLLRIKSNNVRQGTQQVLEYSVSRSRADCFEYRITPSESPT